MVNQEVTPIFSPSIRVHCDWAAVVPMLLRMREIRVIGNEQHYGQGFDVAQRRLTRIEFQKAH